MSKLDAQKMSAWTDPAAMASQHWVDGREVEATFGSRRGPLLTCSPGRTDSVNSAATAALAS